MPSLKGTTLLPFQSVLQCWEQLYVASSQSTRRHILIQTNLNGQNIADFRVKIFRDTDNPQIFANMNVELASSRLHVAIKTDVKGFHCGGLWGHCNYSQSSTSQPDKCLLVTIGNMAMSFRSPTLGLIRVKQSRLGTWICFHLAKKGRGLRHWKHSSHS